MGRSQPTRIVSLVPSISEALFVLGLGGRVVGITRFCVHPANDVEAVRKVGGTKDPDIDTIVRLAPDLVIANREENTERVVRRLEAAGLRVWVTYPRSVREGVALLREVVSLGADPANEGVVVECEAALEQAEAECSARPSRVFCPIWRDPWMTISADTYVHDMLRLCGGDNVFAAQGRLRPARREPQASEVAAQAGRRYPRISLADVVAAEPDVVLLPDEPYAFAQADADELLALDIPAASDGRIHLIDGTWVSWYGPRIALAIQSLRSLLSPP